MRTVLYIAFAAVTLWLLWEVLMQYKARLRWRVVALVGFLLVAGGLFVLGSRVVIGLGAVMFAVGQVKVTMSYRSGFSDGWALGPHPEDDEEDDRPRPRRREAEAYDDFDEPAPLPRRATYDETPQAEPATAQFSAFGAGPQTAPAGSGGYDAYGGGYDTGSYATAGYDTGGYDNSGYAAPAPAAAQAYDTGGYSTVGGYPGQDQSQGGQQIYAQTDNTYAGYSDPYTGTQYATPATPSYYDSGTGGGTYDTGSYQTTGGYDQQQQYGGDPGYAAPGYDTGSYQQQPGSYAADGTWVPQQREGEAYDSGQYPTQQPGYTGYEGQGQYRY